MKKLILFIFLCSISLVSAQKTDSTSGKWTPKGIAGFNISQVAFSDWVKGGDNTITYSLVGNFALNYESPEMIFTNSLKLAYGQTKLGTGSFRTNDNEFYLESVVAKKISWAVDPYFSNTVRTIIAPGYKVEGDVETKIADFFDPGYISQSLGFTFSSTKIFKTRLGLALQETFTNKHRVYSDDGETLLDMEAFKLESGLESVTDIEYGFMENMVLVSKLRLFTRFDDLAVWDVRWDNTINAKINKYFSVNINFIALHETNQSLRTQMKQSLQFGVSYVLF